MLAAPKASLNSLFHSNLVGSGYQVTLVQGKSFSSGRMDPRSQEWDHFIQSASHYLIAHSTERGKAQTLGWVKVNVRADSHFPILAALYSWSFPPTPVFQSQVLFFCSFLFIPPYFLLLQLLFFSSLSFPYLTLFFYLPQARFPQQNIADS